MALILNGTDGLSDVDGTAATPAIRGTDTNTGIFFPAADTIAFSEGGAEVARFDSAGNLGIGVTTPAFKAEIVGGADTVETTLLLVRSNAGGINTGTTIALGNSTNPVAGSGRVELAGLRDTSSGSSFVVRTADSGGTVGERVRITSSGDVTIGTTTANGKLSATTTAAAQYAGYFTFVSSGYGVGIRSSSNGASDLMYFFSPNYVGGISSNGTNTAYNSASDYRLKENIAPMTGALATVAQLKPVTYRWKSNGSNGQGFIAHELQAVCPDAVCGEKDAMRTEQYEISPAVPATYDKENNELTPAVEAVMGEREVPAYQGVDTSFLVATLTAAIQELKAELDTVKAELVILKAQP